jgi:cGMP-dependent 3',5'-cyclic phosphodiesterase
VFDEEVAMAFSVYCGISIMHSLVYRKMEEAQARNRLINELMIYHMKVRVCIGGILKLTMVESPL